MTRQFAIAAIAAATLAAGPMFATEAAAKDGRRTNTAIGIIAGIGGALLGAAIVNAQPQYQAQPRYQAEPRYYEPSRGYDRVSLNGGYDADQERCFRQPVRHVNRYTGEVIIIGSTMVCR
jgi:hypothetical protein